MTPSSGSSAVARDAGIIVRGLPAFASAGPTQFAEVELIDAESEQAVPLRSLTWYALGGSEETLAFHPAEPLESLHSYRVEATPIDMVGDGSQGPMVVADFATSSELLEPIVLSGKLSLSLRGDDVDIITCGPCGNACMATGKRRALLVDVQLPAPSGGQGVYRGALHFTDNTPARASARNPGAAVVEPHDVTVTQFVKVEAGEALLLQQEVFDGEHDFAGCFTFVVWDPAGHFAETSSCLPVLSADDIAQLAGSDAQVPLSTDADVAAEQVEQAVADRHDVRVARGCAVSASQSLTGCAWIVLLLTSFLGRSPSRRRSGVV